MICAGFLTGCDSTATRGPAFPEQPTREAYEGFQWEIVAGAGLKFWAQRNPEIHLETDPRIPGAKIVWSAPVRSGSKMILRIFPLPHGQIEDVLTALQKTPDWNDTITCTFQPKPSGRKGVSRYYLTPSGKYADQLQKQGQSEPIPTTCGGWGIGNSGIRYFEMHDNHPDKAIFVEIGQEAPLFDEESIVLTD